MFPRLLPCRIPPPRPQPLQEPAMNKWTTLALTLFFLVGCADGGKLRELRDTAPSGSAYDAALSRAYLSYSEERARACDWQHSQLFAEKGLNAAYGKDTPVEDPTSWNIAEVFLPELVKARETLMERLTPEVKAGKIEQAVHAQLLYEQWLVTQKYGWDVAKVERLKQEFYAAVEALKPAMPTVEAPMPAAEAAPAPANTSYIIFFGLNSAKLDQDAERIVLTVVEDLKNTRDYEVILNGHTDRSGKAMHNLALSQKRADAVKGSLVKKGLAEKAITTFAFGESDPKVPTADGVKEAKNRRVEIFLTN
ncbi:MAG: OmpA family protein [Alphaproteobacteria bacterium]|nr:OmpA family protein [Alphaproteobacteria bacterium]